MGVGAFALLGLVVVTACFAIGGVNPATIIARARGVDVTAVGSGNPGATNAARALGRGWGVLVALLDVLKGLVPTLLASRALGVWMGLAAGLALVLGHVYSPWLGGRGGKGVATSMGAILVVVPWVGVAAAAVFAIAAPFVRRLGDASMLAACGILGVAGWLGVRGDTALERATASWLALLAGIVLWRHRRNLEVFWAGLRR